MAITRQMERARRELEIKAEASKKLPCRYFDRGNAFCRHGDACYYLHKVAKHKVDNVDHTCHICYEVPSKYGILPACKHKFCLDCITHWSHQHEVELVCPLCRTVSHIIVPANFAPSAKQCEIIVQTFIKRCSSQPCRWFERANNLHIASVLHPWCPAYNDCYFSHEINGRRFIFTEEYIAAKKKELALNALDEYTDDSEVYSLSWGSAAEDFSDEEEEGPVRTIQEP